MADHVFRGIESNNVQVTPIEVSKTWTKSTGTYESKSLADSSTLLDTINDAFNKWTLFRSTNRLFYDTPRYAGQTLIPFISGSEYTLFALSRDNVGQGVSPKTFTITSGSDNYSDDGVGNILSGSTQLGNIFYEEGVIVTSVESFNPPSMSWDSTTTIYEWSTLINVPANTLRNTANPTVIDTTNTASYSYDTQFTSSEFDPYITSIGLYNSDNELLAIAKLSEPVRKVKHIDLNFEIRIDL